MSELMATLKRLLTRGRRSGAGREALDRERAASMADEGGVAAAEVEAQPSLARPEGSDAGKDNPR